MPKMHRLALLFLFVLLAFFLIFFSVVIFEPFKKPNSRTDMPSTATLGSPTVTFIDPRRGNVHGTIPLVEFGDYQCQFCKDMEPSLNAVLAEHPNLTLIWKDLPNSVIHNEAQNAALAARCAGRQGKFWEYHDLLFANQGGLGTALYPRLAEQIGLAAGKFAACLKDQEEKPIVLRNIDEAIALGVDGTPYFFLGSLRFSGQVRAEDLRAAVDALSPQK